MKKRKHTNTTRLTARERAEKIAYGVRWTSADGLPMFTKLSVIIERALQAHARETLDRYKRREELKIRPRWYGRKKADPNRAPCTTKGTTRVSCTCHRYVKGKWVSTEKASK